MRTTFSTRWIVAHDGRAWDIQAPLFSSRQIKREVLRANAERRSGRTDWVAIDLEGVMIAYGDRRRRSRSRSRSGAYPWPGG